MDALNYEIQFDELSKRLISIEEELVDLMKQEIKCPVECLKLLQDISDRGSTIKIGSPLSNFEIECTNIVEAKAEEAEAMALIQAEEQW